MTTAEVLVDLGQQAGSVILLAAPIRVLLDQKFSKALSALADTSSGKHEEILRSSAKDIRDLLPKWGYVSTLVGTVVLAIATLVKGYWDLCTLFTG